MTPYRTWRAVAGLAGICLLAGPGPAAADIVRFSTGRIMSVDSARFDGDTVILMLRGGGEVRAPRNIIDELLPDEVPYARSVALEALAASPAARVTASASAIRAMVDRIAGQVGLDRKLAHAVVATESNYKPQAVSSRGAMGLMQIMPVIARQYAVADPFDPERNLEAGMRHLKSLLGRFPDIRRALAAYNAGESAVSRYGGVPPYRETQLYVQRIMAALR